MAFDVSPLIDFVFLIDAAIPQIVGHGENGLFVTRVSCIKALYFA